MAFIGTGNAGFYNLQWVTTRFVFKAAIRSFVPKLAR